jgi:hypothetical protein
MTGEYESLNDMPQNYYQAKQLVSKLGLGVKRIDCCVNGCMLFYSNEFGVSDDNLVECKFCQEPRYRQTKNSRSSKSEKTSTKEGNVLFTHCIEVAEVVCIIGNFKKNDVAF